VIARSWPSRSSRVGRKRRRVSPVGAAPYRGASTPRERRWQRDDVFRVAAAFDLPNQPDEPLDPVLGDCSPRSPPLTVPVARACSGHQARDGLQACPPTRRTCNSPEARLTDGRPEPGKCLRTPRATDQRGCERRDREPTTVSTTVKSPKSSRRI